MITNYYNNHKYVSKLEHFDMLFESAGGLGTHPVPPVDTPKVKILKNSNYRLVPNCLLVTTV